MKAKDLLIQVSDILNINIKELAAEQKGKSILVRRYNEELNGMIIAKYNARKDAVEII